MADRLRMLWDFGDLDASERRFRAALAEERSSDRRAEILTQLARVEGLRGEFEAGELLLEEAEPLAAADGPAAVRIDLERGRLRRSNGDREAAVPEFESAFEKAVAAGEWFLGADAAHMAALAAPDRTGFVEWTERGIALGEEHEEAAYWAGPLLNNLGWELYEAGEHEQALDVFQQALEARLREPENEEPIALARYAVGKALRMLGRSRDAIPQLERAVAWAAAEGKPDGWFHEELALEYADAGRDADAAEQAQLAIPLLEEVDPAFTEGAERRARLSELAGARD